MKKVVAISLIALFAVSMVACTKAGDKQMKVKCPACGYEFVTPIQ